MKLTAIVLFSNGSYLVSCSNIASSLTPLPMLVLVVSFLVGDHLFIRFLGTGSGSYLHIRHWLLPCRRYVWSFWWMTMNDSCYACRTGSLPESFTLLQYEGDSLIGCWLRVVITVGFISQTVTNAPVVHYYWQYAYVRYYAVGWDEEAVTWDSAGQRVLGWHVADTPGSVSSAPFLP